MNRDMLAFELERLQDTMSGVIDRVDGTSGDTLPHFPTPADKEGQESVSSALYLARAALNRQRVWRPATSNHSAGLG